MWDFIFTRHTGDGGSQCHIDGGYDWPMTADDSIPKTFCFPELKRLAPPYHSHRTFLTMSFTVVNMDIH